VIILGINLWGAGEIAKAVVCIVSGIFVIPIGILSIIVGIKLWRGAKNLENYTNTEKEEDLKEALKNLSAYYTLIGWITAIGLAVLALVLIAILVLGLWLGLEILSK
jgi:CHASE3 domain sensor protein